MDRARRITEDFLGRPIFGSFSVVINPRDLEGYSDKIRKAIDLGTILKNLNSKRYTNTAEWLDDVKLVFQNSVDYWPEQSSWWLIGQYGLTEVDRLTAGMNCTTEQCWLEQVDKVTEKLAADIARQPSGSEASKLAEDIKRRAAASVGTPNIEVMTLVEKLNPLMEDAGSRATVFEILKTVEGGDFTTDKPIDAESLNQQTIRALTIFADCGA